MKGHSRLVRRRQHGCSALTASDFASGTDADGAGLTSPARRTGLRPLRRSRPREDAGPKSGTRHAPPGGRGRVFVRRPVWEVGAFAWRLGCEPRDGTRRVPRFEALRSRENARTAAGTSPTVGHCSCHGRRTAFGAGSGRRTGAGAPETAPAARSIKPARRNAPRLRREDGLRRGDGRPTEKRAIRH